MSPSVIQEATRSTFSAFFPQSNSVVRSLLVHPDIAVASRDIYLYTLPKRFEAHRDCGRDPSGRKVAKVDHSAGYDERLFGTAEAIGPGDWKVELDRPACYVQIIDAESDQVQAVGGRRVEWRCGKFAGSG